MNTGTGRLTQYSPLLSHPPHPPHILHTLFFPTECLQFEKCVQLGLCTAVPRKISEHEWYELYVSAPPDTDILEYMRDPDFERYDRAMSTLRRLYRSATTTSRLSAVRLVKVLSALQYPPRKLPVRASVAWVGGSRVDLPNIVGEIEGPPLASPVVVVKVSDPLSRLVKTAAAATAIGHAGGLRIRAENCPVQGDRRHVGGAGHGLQKNKVQLHPVTATGKYAGTRVAVF